jgi:hypothetical protein
LCKDFRLIVDEILTLGPGPVVVCVDRGFASAEIMVHRPASAAHRNHQISNLREQSDLEMEETGLTLLKGTIH